MKPCGTFQRRACQLSPESMRKRGDLCETCPARKAPEVAPPARHRDFDGVTHDLKIDPGLLEDVRMKRKRAELRRDDRDPPFDVGHRLRLRGYDRTCSRCLLEKLDASTCIVTREPILATLSCKGEPHGYNGEEVLVRVTHVTRGPHVPRGLAMLSIEVIG